MANDGALYSSACRGFCARQLRSGGSGRLRGLRLTREGLLAAASSSDCPWCPGPDGRSQLHLRGGVLCRRSDVSGLDVLGSGVSRNWWARLPGFRQQVAGSERFQGGPVCHVPLARLACAALLLFRCSGLRPWCPSCSRLVPEPYPLGDCRRRVAILLTAPANQIVSDILCCCSPVLAEE